MSYFYIEVDISDVVDELDRIIDGPSKASILELEAILSTQFQKTQQTVHIITGSLKNSGKANSIISEDSWVGKISYGGMSPGFPHNPVKYAHYEQERESSHDYMAGIYSMDSLYGQALESWLKGDVT